MSQYRNGIINSTGAAVNLPLGFVPDRFTITNYTKTAAGSGVGFSEWIKNVVPSARAFITTYTAGAPVVTLLAANGITPVSAGGLWLGSTYAITTISNANPGVVTLAAISGTNKFTLVNGMTITLSGINGMKGLNTNRFIVSGLAGAGPYTFNLYDTFGNPVNTSALGTFATSPNAQLDIISYPPTAPTLDPVTGQVLIPGSPAGLQYDTGYEGVTLGTGVVGSNADVLYWEAFLETPTGY